jgi:hypothetical protein
MRYALAIIASLFMSGCGTVTVTTGQVPQPLDPSVQQISLLPLIQVSF